MLYVVNVEACIHQENYGIFFYEQAAKRKIELFDATWDGASLAGTFSQIAAHINRREFEDTDYQVIVCVRKHPRVSRHQTWCDTTLYAKTLVAQALEQSGMASVLTSSYTRKVTIIFQAEQEYFGSAEQTSSWEEEQEGLRCFLSSLQSACDAASAESEKLDRDSEAMLGSTEAESETKQSSESLLLVDSFGLPAVLTPDEWEHTLFTALSCATQGSAHKDSVTDSVRNDLTTSDFASQNQQKHSYGMITSTENWLRGRLLLVMEEEKALDEKLNKPEEEIPEAGALPFEDEEQNDGQGEYISHRLRSLIDGSKIGRVCEVIYWPVAAKSSQASTLAMFGLTELLCTNKEITKESIQVYQTQGDPHASRLLQRHFASVLAGYRYQLGKKRQQIIREIQFERSAENAALENSALESIVLDSYGENDAHDAYGSSRYTEATKVPSAPQDYLEHLANVKMQLNACKFSLQEGKRNEMKERVEQASEILIQATDGLEEELISYEKTAAKTLYREADQAVSVGFGHSSHAADTTDEAGAANAGTKKKDERRTEAAAKEMITKWKTDMGFLVGCAKLTGFIASFLYLCGCIAVIAGLYFGVHKSGSVQSVYAGLCAMAIVGLVLVVGSFRISAFFMQEIRKSFDELQGKLEEVMQAYRFRAQDYEESLNAWLLELNKQQSENDRKQKHSDRSEQTSARAWHLANMKRILDSLEAFGFEHIEQEFFEKEDPVIASRIVQPMDYRQKEIGNEIYWPVWTAERGKNS